MSAQHAALLAAYTAGALTMAAVWGMASKPDHVADASKMVEPAPVVEHWHPGAPFTPTSVVAEPTGRVR